MRPSVTFLYITRDRHEHLAESMRTVLAQDYAPLDIVVLDNGSVDETPALFEGEFASPNIRYVRSEENLGVAGGRNAALEHAHGDFIFTIDDDAVLRDPSATRQAVERLLADDTIGVLAFKVVDYWSGGLERGAFPSKDKTRNPDEEFETTWFIGAGHLIPRRVYDEVGVYGEYFPYSHEEVDLSLRILDADYRIVFFPQVTMYHKKIITRSTWRKTPMLALSLQNRLKVSIRNLPWIYVLTTDLVRSTQVVTQHSKGNIFAVILAHWNLLRQMPRLLRERKVIKPATVRRVLKMKGPVLF